MRLAHRRFGYEANNASYLEEKTAPVDLLNKKIINIKIKRKGDLYKNILDSNSSKEQTPDSKSNLLQESHVNEMNINSPVSSFIQSVDTLNNSIDSSQLNSSMISNTSNEVVKVERKLDFNNIKIKSRKNIQENLPNANQNNNYSSLNISELLESEAPIKLTTPVFYKSDGSIMKPPKIKNKINIEGEKNLLNMLNQDHYSSENSFSSSNNFDDISIQEELQQQLPISYEEIRLTDFHGNGEEMPEEISVSIKPYIENFQKKKFPSTTYKKTVFLDVSSPSSDSIEVEKDILLESEKSKKEIKEIKVKEIADVSSKIKSSPKKNLNRKGAQKIIDNKGKNSSDKSPVAKEKAIVEKEVDFEKKIILLEEFLTSKNLPEKKKKKIRNEFYKEYFTENPQEKITQEKEEEKKIEEEKEKITIILMERRKTIKEFDDMYKELKENGDFIGASDRQELEKYEKRVYTAKRNLQLEIEEVNNKTPLAAEREESIKDIIDLTNDNTDKCNDKFQYEIENMKNIFNRTTAIYQEMKNKKRNYNIKKRNKNPFVCQHPANAVNTNRTEKNKGVIEPSILNVLQPKKSYQEKPLNTNDSFNSKRATDNFNPFDEFEKTTIVKDCNIRYGQFNPQDILLEEDQWPSLKTDKAVKVRNEEERSNIFVKSISFSDYVDKDNPVDFSINCMGEEIEDREKIEVQKILIKETKESFHENYISSEWDESLEVTEKQTVSEINLVDFPVEKEIFYEEFSEIHEKQIGKKQDKSKEKNKDNDINKKELPINASDLQDDFTSNESSSVFYSNNHEVNSNCLLVKGEKKDLGTQYEESDVFYNRENIQGNIDEFLFDNESIIDKESIIQNNQDMSFDKDTVILNVLKEMDSEMALIPLKYRQEVSQLSIVENNEINGLKFVKRKTQLPKFLPSYKKDELFQTYGIPRPIRTEANEQYIKPMLKEKHISENRQRKIDKKRRKHQYNAERKLLREAEKLKAQVEQKAKNPFIKKITSDNCEGIPLLKEALEKIPSNNSNNNYLPVTIENEVKEIGIFNSKYVYLDKYKFNEEEARKRRIEKEEKKNNPPPLEVSVVYPRIRQLEEIVTNTAEKNKVAEKTTPEEILNQSAEYDFSITQEISPLTLLEENNKLLLEGKIQMASPYQWLHVVNNFTPTNFIGLGEMTLFYMRAAKNELSLISHMEENLLIHNFPKFDLVAVLIKNTNSIKNLGREKRLKNYSAIIYTWLRELTSLMIDLYVSIKEMEQFICDSEGIKSKHLVYSLLSLEQAISLLRDKNKILKGNFETKRQEKRNEIVKGKAFGESMKNHRPSIYPKEFEVKFVGVMKEIKAIEVIEINRNSLINVDNAKKRDFTVLEKICLPLKNNKVFKILDEKIQEATSLYKFYENLVLVHREFNLFFNEIQKENIKKNQPMMISVGELNREKLKCIYEKMLIVKCYMNEVYQQQIDMFINEGDKVLTELSQEKEFYFNLLEMIKSTSDKKFIHCEEIQLSQQSLSDNLNQLKKIFTKLEKYSPSLYNKLEKLSNFSFSKIDISLMLDFVQSFFSGNTYMLALNEHIKIMTESHTISLKTFPELIKNKYLDFFPSENSVEEFFLSKECDNSLNILKALEKKINKNSAPIKVDVRFLCHMLNLHSYYRYKHLSAILHKISYQENKTLVPISFDKTFEQIIEVFNLTWKIQTQLRNALIYSQNPALHILELKLILKDCSDTKHITRSDKLIANNIVADDLKLHIQQIDKYNGILKYAINQNQKFFYDTFITRRDYIKKLEESINKTYKTVKSNYLLISENFFCWYKVTTNKFETEISNKPSKNHNTTSGKRKILYPTLDSNYNIEEFVVHCKILEE